MLYDSVDLHTQNTNQCQECHAISDANEPFCECGAAFEFDVVTVADLPDNVTYVTDIPVSSLPRL